MSKMPGKPGRSGRTPKRSSSADRISCNESNVRKVGRPKGCRSRSIDVKSGEDKQDISDVTTQSERETKAWKLRIKLRAKNAAENCKDIVIGKGVDILPANRLPVQKIILQRWRSLRSDDILTDSRKNRSNNDIAKQLTQEILEIWKAARIPTKRKDKVQKQLLQLIDRCQTTMKHCDRVNSDPIKTFCSSIDILFDIAPRGLEHEIKHGNPNWEEDLAFYHNQSKVPQVGFMGSVDTDSVAYEKRKVEREKRQEDRFTKELESQSKRKTVTSLSNR